MRLSAPPAATTQYLCIEPFLRDFVLAQGIRHALTGGVIDAVLARPDDTAGLARGLKLDPRALGVLLLLLQAGQVLEPGPAGVWRVSAAFRQALVFRELMLAKLDFASEVQSDLSQRWEQCLRSPEGFMPGSALYALFDYSRAFGTDAQDLEATRRWVRLTTALTRHEAGVLLATAVAQGRRRLLDIGGNSGELARQACEADPALSATVVDLPGVCRIGRQHVAASPAVARIEFWARDALQHPLPRADWVNFKSMLHDWPDPAAEQLLRRGHDTLLPGGQLVIFERCQPAPESGLLSYAFAPMVPFMHLFRSPDWYVQRLRALGCEHVDCLTVQLDSTFCLVRGIKASA